MTFVDGLGYFASLLVLATFSMRTMLPLRLTGIASNFAFIAYGYADAAWPVMALHIILLPLNTLRLYQMMQLVKQVREATRGDLSMDWLKPYMTSRRCRAGDIIFRKDEISECLYYTLNGRYRLNEIGTEIPPGQMIGEIGFVAPEKKRTLTFECTEDGTLLTISYKQLSQLYFQNPKFGLYFLQLIAERLFSDIRRLESDQAAAIAMRHGDAGADGHPL